MSGFYANPLHYPAPHPSGSGYGGVGWDPTRTFTDPLTPEGAALLGYGLVGYGGGVFAAPNLPVSGGYGGDPFGVGPYGGVELEPPRPSSAVSVSDWEIEVYFSEEMSPTDSALLNPASYTLTPVGSAAPATAVSVRVGQLGALSSTDTFPGVSSVILTHTGTTLGGAYLIVVSGPKDVSGNAILPIPVSLLTRGAAPSFTVSPISGNELLLTFAQPLLADTEEPLGTERGVLDPESYVFTSTPDYPVTLRAQSVVFPYTGDTRKVKLQVLGMTNLDYTCSLSPATAFTYSGVHLPSAETSFTGVDVYPLNGTSSIVSSTLVLSRDAGVVYGWSFLDLSGVTPVTSSFRCDVTFNAGAATYDPPLSTFMALSLARILVADGDTGTQVKVTLQRSGGVERLLFESGLWSQALAVNWSSGAKTLSVVRNRKADFYTFLLDGSPLLSTPISNITETSTLSSAGAQVLLLSGALDITGFQILGVNFQATTTVWSGAWNFFHNVVALFEGSDLLARYWLLTKRGPLVKDWGDMTPATKQDVAVRVNGVAVDVAEVNPYWGKVYLTTPIPLLPPGDPEGGVEVDYHWFPTPILTLDGLNTEGAVLNKWDRAIGHHDPISHGAQVQDSTHPKGAVDISRFPMGVVLGPAVRPEPLWVSHRYLGFEKGSSALLNSPTTLMLNQNPRVSQIPSFLVPTKGVAQAFEGTVPPPLADPPWTLLGQDVGGVLGDGVYQVVDAQAGPFDPSNPKVSLYSREVDLSYPSSVYLVGRFRVPAGQPHGVFSGVGFGLHDDHQLYLVGALEVPSGDPLVAPMLHVGLLQDPSNIYQLGGWKIGPVAAGTILDATHIQVPSASTPNGFGIGSRFEIVAGTQAGFYTASAVTLHSNGLTEIAVTPSFPVNPNLYGNKYFDVLFEVDWTDAFSTYRLVVDPKGKTATLDVSGALSGRVASFDGTAAQMPQPSETSLLLDTQSRGQVFWGSLDSFAVSQSDWSFLRLGVVPDQTALRGFSTTTETLMGTTPDMEPVPDDWFALERFGHTQLMSPGLLLKSTSGSDTLDQIFGFRRIEPFLRPDANLDLRVSLRIDTGTEGADTIIEVFDGQRVVRLGALQYFEGGTPWRQLVSQPAVSFAGFREPSTQGWAYVGSGGNVVSGLAQGPDFTLTVPSGASGRFQGTVSTVGLVCGDSGNRVGEVEVATQVAGYLFTVSSPSGHTINLHLRGGGTPGVKLINETAVSVQEYNFDWTDGELHTYRLVVSNGVASLFLDGTLQAPSVGLGPFATGGSNQFLFGTLSATSETVTRWRSASYSVLPPTSVKRTLGLWLGGDPTDINQWQIPRTDATAARNSDEIGPVIEEMDWRSSMEIRVLKTEGWGVTLLRPDLPMPPYFQDETPGISGSGHATPAVVPSAGWVNLEEAEIPHQESTFGGVSFGALNSRSITQQFWDWVRYRIFKSVTEDHKSPEHMVLNQANVISSGELLLDITLETVDVPTLTSSSVSLLPAHLRASDVYRVSDGTQTFYRTSWTFDIEAQTLTLKGALRFLSDSVSVTFTPGAPVTTTYLLGQPVQDGMTLLNEGTPPIPKSQCGLPDRSGVQGEFLSPTNPEDPNFALHDPYKVITFSDDTDSLYESMTFMEVTNEGSTGLIAIAGEGLLPDGDSGYFTGEGEALYSLTGSGDLLGGVGDCAGLRDTETKIGASAGGHVLGFRGTLFWEKVSTPKSDGVEHGAGLPGKTLFASGGPFVGPIVSMGGLILPGWKPLGGTLGPGTAILAPTFMGVPHRDGTAVNQRTRWQITLMFEERSSVVSITESLEQVLLT